MAISNERLLAVNDGDVTFQWKDYRHKHKENSRVMTLAADEFIRRFLIHTLPPRFRRIRHFGFLANRHRKEKLELCRKLLGNPAVDPLPVTAQCLVLLQALFFPNGTPAQCPKCKKGVLVRLGFFAPCLWPQRPPDTS